MYTFNAERDNLNESVFQFKYVKKKTHTKAANISDDQKILANARIQANRPR